MRPKRTRGTADTGAERPKAGAERAQSFKARRSSAYGTLERDVGGWAARKERGAVGEVYYRVTNLMLRLSNHTWSRFSRPGTVARLLEYFAEGSPKIQVFQISK